MGLCCNILRLEHLPLHKLQDCNQNELGFNNRKVILNGKQCKRDKVAYV